MNKRAYWQGFIEKCHERGVDPRELVKQAQAIPREDTGAYQLLQTMRDYPNMYGEGGRKSGEVWTANGISF